MDDDDIEDLEKSEIYKLIDQDLNIFYHEEDGKTVTELGQNYENPLYKIERFVDEIVSSDQPAFKLSKNAHGNRVAEPLRLGGIYWTDFNAFVNQFNPKYEFSEYVKIFFEACQILQLSFGSFKHPPSLRSAELFNDLVETIRKKARSPDVKKRIYARQHDSVRNYRSAKKYLWALFICYARLLVLRIDFAYVKEYFRHLTIQEVQEHIKHLLNNRRCNSLFNSLAGYIWKLEYGEEKGYHIHFIFLYDGSRVHKDAYLANEIGAYWKERITSGRGVFYNCNVNKNKYRRCGIGMINYFDEEKRHNLLLAAKYLTKKEQYLRVKLSKKCRCFGKGGIPHKKASAAGRPRARKEESGNASTF